MMKNEKLNSKDYITLGIYSAISFVIMLIAGITNLSPYTYLLYPITYSLFNGVIYLYVVTKIPKRGSIVLMNIVPILYLVFTGVQGMISALAILVFALIAELIVGDDRTNMKKIQLSYIVFTGWASIGGEYRFFLSSEGYFAEALQSGLDPAYVDALRGFVDFRWWIGTFIVTIITSYLGMKLGTSIVKKHLKKAGVL